MVIFINEISIWVDHIFVMKGFFYKDDISTKFIVNFIIDFEIFIHLLNDKLRGLPCRVFALFHLPKEVCV